MGNFAWWKKEIIYQVYPRSFMDGSGDGVGDLAGLADKLDYLDWLGVGAIWISPIYPSPMADFGYDITDYREIDPAYGTMDQFDRLLESAHARGIRIILDLVPSHTSDEHPWFGESRSSRNNPKRDWYIWKEPADKGSPPNNWISEFGGSAWEYDQGTGQYYCHTFLKEQPDLNWHNPEVREAFHDIMRFWLDKEVDGFRIDVLWYLIKDDLFRDNPPNPGWKEGMPEHDRLIPVYSSDLPYVHEVVAEIRQVVDEYEDRVLIGEIYLPIGKLVAYYGKEESRGVHLPFNFHLLSSRWEAAEIYHLIAEYEAALPAGGWPNWVLGNHDRPRIRTRAGDNQVQNAAMLLFTLRGTPTMYYGDEIGMKDVMIPGDLIHDPRELREPGIGLGRDPQRTPMQWSAGPDAGFSSATPWLPVDRDHATINVETENTDPDSLLSYYKRLIMIRQKEPALMYGDYFPAGLKDQMLCYTRKHGDSRFLVCLNFGDRSVHFRHAFPWSGLVEVASNRNREGQRLNSEVRLEGGENVLIRI